MVNNMFIWFQIAIATKMFSFKLVFVFNVCGQSLWSLWEAAHHLLLQLQLQLFQAQDQTFSSFHTTAEKPKQIQIQLQVQFQPNRNLWNPQSNLLVLTNQWGAKVKPFPSVTWKAKWHCGGTQTKIISTCGFTSQFDLLVKPTPIPHLFLIVQSQLNLSPFLRKPS